MQRERERAREIARTRITTNINCKNNGVKKNQIKMSCRPVLKENLFLLIQTRFHLHTHTPTNMLSCFHVLFIKLSLHYNTKKS